MLSNHELWDSCYSKMRSTQFISALMLAAVAQSAALPELTPKSEDVGSVKPWFSYYKRSDDAGNLKPWFSYYKRSEDTGSVKPWFSYYKRSEDAGSVKPWFSYYKRSGDVARPEE
jgi:hypothetical protein